MHKRYSVECIVIKRSNTGDADRIITVFSKKYGKLKLIAKGTRKIRSRRAPHIELFNNTKLHLYKGKALDIITEAQSIKTYENMKKDLQKVSTAYFFLELVDRLCPEMVEQDEIYMLLENELDSLNNQSQNDLKEKKDIFGNTLLHNLGYLPPDKRLQGKQLTEYIESLLERKLKTPDILTA